jgi:hypothetical protein
MNPASSTASSSASFIEDIMRLVAPSDRAAFREMVQHELRGRELPADEMRRVAENTWRKFCKVGWPRAS